MKKIIFNMYIMHGGRMISKKEKYFNTITTIKYSDSYQKEKYYQLFNNAISILSKRIREENFSDFSIQEIETLENTMTIIALEG